MGAYVQALERGDPRVIGRCQVLARIGAGGMAVVYLGRSSDGRPVAIKVMHAEFAADLELRDRFRREVAANRIVSGGYTTAVLDADPDAAMPWLATEFLPSLSLSETVGEFGVLPADTVWSLAVGMAEALASIHRAGIVHLDVKPANILLTSDGPRVIDFGIARELDASGAAFIGFPAGSPGFASPEQENGRWVTPASDVYSFGVTLAYAYAKTRADGDGRVALDGITDEALRHMIASCVDPDPTHRPTMPELIHYLLSVISDRRPFETPWLPPAVTEEIDRRAHEAENPPRAVETVIPQVSVESMTPMVPGPRRWTRHQAPGPLPEVSG